MLGGMAKKIVLKGTMQILLLVPPPLFSINRLSLMGLFTFVSALKLGKKNFKKNI